MYYLDAVLSSMISRRVKTLTGVDAVSQIKLIQFVMPTVAKQPKSKTNPCTGLACKLQVQTSWQILHIK